MARPDLITSLTRLSRQIDTLTENNKNLERKLEAIHEENESLKRQHETDILEKERLKKEIEFLSLSHRLADSPEAIVSARNKISTLIRTIDSCIRMINED